MKTIVIKLFHPLLIRLLYWALFSTKSLFLSENERLRGLLKKRCFHPSLVEHPSILYGTRTPHFDSENSSFLLNIKVYLIDRLIRIRVLQNYCDTNLLLKGLAISSFFSHSTESWFATSSSPLQPYVFPKTNTPLPKTVIYTVLTGDYDSVHEILYKENAVEYLLFTNNPYITSKTWKIVFVHEDMNNVLLSRKIKILPHLYLPKEYDYSIYVDANAIIYGELSLLTSYLNEDISFAVSRHHERNSIKEEVTTLIERRMVPSKEVTDQYSQYKSEGFKDDLGLAECSILVRKHIDKDLQKLMESWWSEFVHGVKRDQVSLLPAIQRMDFTGFVFMNGYVRHNQFCRIVDHKRTS